MTPGDIDLDALLKRLHLPTVRRLYGDQSFRTSRSREVLLSLGTSRRIIE